MAVTHARSAAELTPIPLEVRRRVDRSRSMAAFLSSARRWRAFDWPWKLERTRGQSTTFATTRVSMAMRARAM
jgi:hypothetical protein